MTAGQRIECLSDSDADIAKTLDEAGVGFWRLHSGSGSATANSTFYRLIGCQPDGSGGAPGLKEWAQLLHAADREPVIWRYQQMLQDGLEGFELEGRAQHPERLVHLHLRGRIAERDTTGKPLRLSVILTDMSSERDLARARDALRAALEQLAVAARLEAVGQLAAGVAHEINTPAQYVRDSVHFIRETVPDLLDYLERLPPAPAGAPMRDFSYLRRHLPDAVEAAMEGIDRIAEIVRSMKDFACADRRDMHPVDLNRAIQSTLVMAHKQYRDVADLETHYCDLPPVVCHPGDINQVILNLVTNAAQAVGDALQAEVRKGRITISTRLEGDEIVVSVADTGHGIPPEIRARIFDPFFTTKEVGRGTGLGLSISRNIARKHHGTLTFETTLGSGTTFFLRLPLEPTSRQANNNVVALARGVAPHQTARVP